MNRLEEIKNEYAKTFGDYPEWSKFINEQPNYEVEKHMDKVAKKYARECASASLEKANEKAWNALELFNSEYKLMEKSIINPENIVLL